MEPSPEAATTDGGGAHEFSWRAAGVVLVAISFLVGVGMIMASSTIAAPSGEALRPPQPDAAAAGAIPSEEEPEPPASSAPDASESEVPGQDASEPDASEPDAGSEQEVDSAAEPVSMPRSTPTRVRIPRINVDAEIMKLGIDDDGRIEVPPLERAQLAGWYRHGPSPGEVGNAVVVGHVDSYAIGPAVFFELGALKPGDTIEVVRKHGDLATFTVDGVSSYPKEEFPTSLVYGPSDRASLRLVTCGGTFDNAQREYRDNVIVFATLDPDSVE